MKSRLGGDGLTGVLRRTRKSLGFGSAEVYGCTDGRLLLLDRSLLKGLLGLEGLLDHNLLGRSLLGDGSSLLLSLFGSLTSCYLASGLGCSGHVDKRTDDRDGRKKEKNARKISGTPEVFSPT